MIVVREALPPAAELTFDDVAPGQVFEVTRRYAQEDLLAYAALSGDYSPLHVDPDYAGGTEFGGCVVHGMLLASLFSQLVGMRIPGRHALYLGQDLVFRRPVMAGETVRAIARVIGKTPATRTITLAMELRDAADRIAVAGSARVKIRDGIAAGVADAPAAAVPAAASAATCRVAVVMGGSGGIGAAIARVLAERGHAVAVHYHRNRQAAAAVAAAIRAAGGRALVAQADIRDPQEVGAALSIITEDLGAPTVLINAAAGALDSRPFVELEWSDFLRDLEYQVKAVAQMCRAVYPAMAAGGGGAIVNISSQVAAGAPPPRCASYVTAKCALAGLSRALAVEWADAKIRVNTVSPGLVETPLTAHYHERVFKMEAAHTPLKRLATPLDVARAVGFLVSDEAAFLTGVDISVTGGQVMS